jgi:hypothetical protein
MITLWNGPNVFVGNKYLDFVTQLAAYNTDYAGAYLGAYDPTNLKDIDATQEQYFQESVWYATDLLHNLGSQAFMRKANKLLTESDASGYWAQESWDSFLSGIENRNIFVPLVSINLGLSFNVGWILSKAYPLRNLPTTMYYRWKTVETLANAKTTRDAIISRQAGARIHAAKFNLPMVKLTSDMLNNFFRFVPIGSDEWLFHFTSDLLKVDVGGVETLHCACSPTGAQFQGNKVASYEDFIMTYVNDYPSDLYAFSPVVGNAYQAVNNLVGALTHGTVSNDTTGILWCAQDDVVMSELVNTSITLAGLMSAGVLGASQCVAGGLTTAWNGAGFTPLLNQNGDVFHKSDIVYSEWEDMRRTLFQYMLKFPYPFGGAQNRDANKSDNAENAQ